MPSDSLSPREKPFGDSVDELQVRHASSESLEARGPVRSCLSKTTLTVLEQKRKEEIFSIIKNMINFNIDKRICCAILNVRKRRFLWIKRNSVRQKWVS